jgi:drug/metabolite transporter (DMT)-like permease
MARSSSLVGAAIVAGAAVMFGMLGPITRFSYELGLAPFAFIAWRSAVGMLGAGGLVAWRQARIPADERGRAGARSWAPATPGSRGGVALLAAAGGAFLVNVGMFVAFQRIPVAIVLLTFYTYPALVALVAVALGRERLDRPRAVALGLASLGALLVVAAQPGDASLGIDLVGIGLALVAAAGQTVFVTVSRDGFAAIRSDMAIALVLAFTAGAGAVSAVIEGTGADLARPLGQPTLLALLLFAGLFTAAVPSILLLSGIRRLGGVRAGTLMLIEPMVGVILAALLLAEPVQPIQLVGGLAILAAALILTRAPVDPGDRSPASTSAVASATPAVALREP